MMKLEMNFETKILKQKKSQTKENQIVKWPHLILLWGRPEVGFVGCMTMELGFDGVTDAKAFFFASVS